MATAITRKAVMAAYHYLKTVSPQFSKFSNFRLEETTIDKDKNFSITLSYDVKGEFAFDIKREYKDFVVDEKGETVLSMKIRKI